MYEFSLVPFSVCDPVTVNATVSATSSTSARPATVAPSAFVSAVPSYTFSALGVVTVSVAGLIIIVCVPVSSPTKSSLVTRTLTVIGFVVLASDTWVAVISFGLVVHLPVPGI